MKIFKSLNCILCEKPFVPVAGQSQSPRHLGCGSAMCHGCFEKEKPLKEKERKHQCATGEACFTYPKFADFLIDVISQDSLTLSPILGGYLLQKAFKIPECPICHDEYSNQTCEKKSIALGCNHVICKQCYLKIRKPNQHDATKEKYKYETICPTCEGGTVSYGDEWLDQLQNFLNELPGMMRQLEEMNDGGYRFCMECKKLCTVDEMFHCNKCVLKLCGACIYKNHRSHKANTLLQNEACQMSEELCALSLNEIKTYNNLFPALHKDITDALQEFEQKLLKKEKNLKDPASYVDLKEKHQKCMRLKKDFESYSKDYIPDVRRYETRMRELIKTLDEDPN